MIMVCHNLSPKIPSDVAFAESRIRAETIVAENVLHDMGAISMIGSDSQAVGRVGETFLRTFQTADLMKRARGKLPEDADGNDNFRVLRYLAKVTLNPCIANGAAHVLGSITPGKMADLVLWEPAFFAAKPKMVIKGGFIIWANMGDPNASLATVQPMMFRPMFGASAALQKTCISFVSQIGYDEGIAEKYELERIVMPVRHTRMLTKSHMVRNDLLPKVEVNPETYAVMVNGEHATFDPPRTIALNQMYFFS